MYSQNSSSSTLLVPNCCVSLRHATSASFFRSLRRLSAVRIFGLSNVYHVFWRNAVMPDSCMAALTSGSNVLPLTITIGPL